MAISRALSKENLNRMKKECAFLIDVVNNSQGEYFLALRDGYFNVYYRGNSLVKVIFIPNAYCVSINKKFFKDTAAAKDSRFKNKDLKKDSYKITIAPADLHPLLQAKHLKEFSSRIKNENFCEEMIWEQLIITENISREDLIIIDRQVTDTELNRKRMDLLVLKQSSENQYYFLVIEVKLGNNIELDSDVDEQLKLYTNHISGHFPDYIPCYESQYIQKKGLGLIECRWDSIKIIEKVEGIVVVGGYPKQADARIRNLKQKNPAIQVQRFDFRIK